MSEANAIWAALAEALLRAPGQTPTTVSKLILSAPTNVSWDLASVAEWASTQQPVEITHSAIHERWEKARTAADLGIHAFPINSAHYPASLRLIEDPPPVLYVRGNLALLHAPPGVAIVGTRKASSAGIIIAKRIAQYFAGHDWTVISGLALGIDAAAHRGALAAAGGTIAVLAHGLKGASPKANALLADEILLNGGAWVSEHPADVPARPENFVLRNRIQIGLSAGSIIVEGEERSGTMTQAEFCLRNHRSLFAVFPSTAEELKLVSKGPLILINKRGATAVRSKDDYPSVMNRLQATRERLGGSQSPAA